MMGENMAPSVWPSLEFGKDLPRKLPNEWDRLLTWSVQYFNCLCVRLKISIRKQADPRSECIFCAV